MNTLNTSILPDFTTLLSNQFWSVEMIRSDTWPLLVEIPIQSDQIWTFAKWFGISTFLVTEVFSLLQWFGFIDWRKIFTHNDAKLTPNERIFQILDRWSRSQKEEWSLKEILNFFQQLSQINCVKKINALSKTKEDFPFGIFRFTSLFDIDIQRFSNLKQFLDFLLINIQEQEKFFLDALMNSFENNGWMPVDHVPEKSSLFLSESEFAEITRGNILGREVGIALRIIPWFWPPWILFALSLNLPNSWGKNSTENICTTIWLRFEEIEWNIIPVIHTIQNFLHNVGINEQTGELITVSEGSLTLNERLLNDSEKKKIKWSLDLIFSGNSFQLFLACVAELLFEIGYNEVQIIDGTENLWLMEHNQKRWTESVKKSAKTLYQDNWLALWWSILNSGRVWLSRMGVAQFISKFPKHADISEKFFQAYIQLSRRQRFRTIVDEIIDNADTQGFIGEFVWRERQRLLDGRIFIS
jgi:hypothetical protein